MARSSLSSQALPLQATTALRLLGERLRRARISRRWTIANLANRIYVTPATVRRLEAGHPGVSLGVLSTALFLFEMLPDLDGVATLKSDRIAAMRVEDALPKRVRPRKSRLDF